MSIETIFGLLVLLVGVPLNTLVVVLLWRRSHANPGIRVLGERLVVAAFVLLVVTVFGLIFVNNDTVPPPLDISVTRLVTRTSMLLIAIVPAAYWLWLWFWTRR